MKKLVLVSLFLIALYSRNMQAQTYQIVDLGTLGGTYSQAEGINNSGQVVGFAYLPDGNAHGFLYLNGLMQDIGTFGGSQSDAVAVNQSGQVAGYAQISGDSKAHAYLRLTNGILQDIDTLNTAGGSVAGAMNNSGQVVGYIIPSDGRIHSFLYSNGAMQDLGTFGGTDSAASGINDSGQIVGKYTTGDGIEHPFLRQTNGTVIDLGSLGGSGFARAINSNGWVIGRSGNFNAFLYTNSTMINLGPGAAFGINNLGQIVGTSYPYTGHAVIFTNGIEVDLNDLIPSSSGWVLREAWGVNDSGWIVGYGDSPSGQTHAFLLQPMAIPLKITGSTITMGVSAVGTSLTYQWSLKNQSLSGATMSSLTITNGAQTGIYKVTVTDGNSQTASQSFNVSIKP